MLTAELIDNDCWPALIELVENRQAELAERFRKARERNEQEHLELVRTWIATGTGRSAERATTAGAETARKPMRAAAKAGRRKSKREASPTSSKKRARSRATKNPRAMRARAVASRQRVSYDTLGVFGVVPALLGLPSCPWGDRPILSHTSCRR